MSETPASQDDKSDVIFQWPYGESCNKKLREQFDRLPMPADMPKMASLKTVRPPVNSP
jgi:hypothetical protein